MKQKITPDQIRELNDKESERFNSWLKEKRYKNCLTVGQLIEYLQENGDFIKDREVVVGEAFNHIVFAGDLTVGWRNGDELCDALWKEVKELLESND